MSKNFVKGTLMIDEMALTARLYFNEKTKLVEGFVNYGEFTPAYLKKQRADHALEFMFRPFRGQWVQVYYDKKHFKRNVKNLCHRTGKSNKQK